MNILLKIGAFSALTFGLFACGLTELDEFLTDPVEVSPENADVSLVMNSAQIEFSRIIDEVSDETSPYVRLRAMQGGIFYEAQDGPSTFDFLWTTVYGDLFPDLDLVISASDEGNITLLSGAARVMKAYTLYTLVDLFGDVPFSEIGQGTDVISPVADDDQSVYIQADNILDMAISNLSDPAGSFSNDLYYGGDADKWLALANTLKLRRAVQTRLADGSAATINSILADGNIIDEIDEDFQWQYGTTLANPDSRAPEYAASYQSGAVGYMSNYYMWLFLTDRPLVDPRLRYYFYRQDCDETDEDAFTLQCATEAYPAHWPNGFPFCTATGDFGNVPTEFGGYWGRDHGNADGIPPDDTKRTVFGLYPFGGKFDADDCSGVANNGTDGGRGAGIQPIFLSSYTHFLLAEAALTMGVDGDARDYFEVGVRQSIEKAIGFSSVAEVAAEFEPTEEEVEGFVTTVMNAYDAAESDDDRLNEIVKEFFKALHGQGLDAYNAYRRTGKPANMQPTEQPGEGAFPRTLWYPNNYVNRNNNQTQKGDLTTQVFWDTNPADFIN